MLVNFDSMEEWANGDVPTMKEIIRLFMENTPPTLDLLGAAIGTWDWDGVVRHAHKLKSSYSIVTVANGYALIQGIEVAGREQRDTDKIVADFATVRQQYAEAVKEFEAFMAQGA